MRRVINPHARKHHHAKQPDETDKYA